VICFFEKMSAVSHLLPGKFVDAHPALFIFRSRLEFDSRHSGRKRGAVLHVTQADCNTSRVSGGRRICSEFGIYVSSFFVDRCREVIGLSVGGNE